MASAPKLPQPVKEHFNFGPWTVQGVKSHILKSEGESREKFEADLAPLPQFPEMVFADNVLRIKHSAGFGIEFTALAALRLVDSEHDLVKVAVADDWREARQDCDVVLQTVKPFDWTFTTDYTGTLLGSGENRFEVCETSERIDLERLKQREKIAFYQDILLFEDELADNGCSMLSVKIRVMPTSFFLLQRLFMRVDGVMVRCYDTRIYHQAGTDYFLREFSKRESSFSDLSGVDPHKLTDPVEIYDHLQLQSEVNQKLKFPPGAPSV